MACTRTLYSSLSYVRPFLGYEPLLIGGQEPALTAANKVKQKMLGAPLSWRWNRRQQDILCTNQQDYALVDPNFGFIEKFWLTDPDEDGGERQVKEIPVMQNLSAESAVERPASACVLMDDNAGNLTVRLNNVPDKQYTLTVQSQNKARLLTSAASFWAPIPDELSYIYDEGFLAECCLLIKDARFPIFRQNFLSNLLSLQDGLDSTQRNIFIGDFLNEMRSFERAQLGTQKAVAGSY